MTKTDLTHEEAVDPWLLFVEQQPRWSAATRVELRRQGRDTAITRLVTRQTCPRMLSLWTIDQPLLLAIDITKQNLTEALHQIAGVREMPLLAAVALVPPQEFAAESFQLLRSAAQEAGAAATFTSPRQSAELLAIGDRHARHAWRLLAEQIPLHERVWRRLPWQSAARAIG
ncbi:MAG: hypothetical protein AAGF31_05120 [Planctomycetota bacterium]